MVFEDASKEACGGLQYQSRVHDHVVRQIGCGRVTTAVQSLVAPQLQLRQEFFVVAHAILLTRNLTYFFSPEGLGGSKSAGAPLLSPKNHLTRETRSDASSHFIPHRNSQPSTFHSTDNSHQPWIRDLSTH